MRSSPGLSCMCSRRCANSHVTNVIDRRQTEDPGSRGIKKNGHDSPVIYSFNTILCHTKVATAKRLLFHVNAGESKQDVFRKKLACPDRTTPSRHLASSPHGAHVWKKHQVQNFVPSSEFSVRSSNSYPSHTLQARPYERCESQARIRVYVSFCLGTHFLVMKCCVYPHALLC